MIRKTFSRKGYTLLEVTIVAAIIAVLFALGARWVVTLTEIAVEPLEGSSSTQISYALDRLETDLGSLKACGSYNETNPLKDAKSNSLLFWTESNTFVSWKLEDDALQRAETAPADSASCVNAPVFVPEDWENLAQGVKGKNGEAQNPALFLGVIDGRTAPISTEVKGINISIESIEDESSTSRTVLLEK